MFDHVSIRVADYSASERFYRTTLEQLGIEPTHAGACLPPPLG
jgi:catechol 2,3-dioxygenase-like lactoylglutathione lyase family enzyme